MPDWDAQDKTLKAQGITGGILEVEAKAKTTSYVLLFVFDSRTRAIATLNEVVEFMFAGQQKLVLVAGYVEPGQAIAGQALTVEEAMDINLARAKLFGIAKSYGVRVFDNIEDAVIECAYLCKIAAQDHHVMR